MNKTISARFESVDLATVAASAVKARCTNVKLIKLRYERQSHPETAGVFSNMFTPVDISASPIVQNGMIPQTLNSGAFREKEQRESQIVENKKARLEIIAPQDQEKQISSILRNHGGWSVKSIDTASS